MQVEGIIRSASLDHGDGPAARRSRIEHGIARCRAVGASIEGSRTRSIRGARRMRMQLRGERREEEEEGIQGIQGIQGIRGIQGRGSNVSTCT